MLVNNKVKIIVNYILIVVIVFVFCGLSYSYGVKNTTIKMHRPIYVKYETVSNTKNLEKILIKAEIRLTEQQFIDLTTNLKIKDK
jgi:hypothetical protein